MLSTILFPLPFLLGAVFSTEEAGPWCEVPELSALKYENWPVLPENFSYNTDITNFWEANGWTTGSVPRDDPDAAQMDFVEFRILTLDGIDDYTFAGGFEDQRGQELAVLTRTVDTTGRYKLRIRNYGFFVHVKITPPGFDGSEQEYVVGKNTEETIYFDAVAGDTLTITEEVGLIVVRDFQLLCSHIPQEHENYCEVPELGALIQDHWPVYPDDDTNNADVVGFWEENGWTVHSVPRNSPNDAELQHVRFEDANDNGVLLDRVFGGGFMERGQEVLHLTRTLSTTGKYKLRLMNYGFFVFIKISTGSEGNVQEFTCGKNTEETFYFEANAGDTLEISESIGKIAVREFSVLCSDEPSLEMCEDAELTTLIPSHWPELPAQEGPNQNIVDFWWANTWAAATSSVIGQGTRQDFFFKKFEDSSGNTHWAIDGDSNSDRGDEKWLFWKALPETGTYKFSAMNYGFNIWINVVTGGNINKYHIGKNRARTIYFQANAGDMIGILEIDGITHGEGLMEVLEFKSPCAAGECPAGEEMVDGVCEEMKCRLLSIDVCGARDDCVVKRANGNNPRCKKNKCRLYETQDECLSRGCFPVISRRGRFRRCS